MSVPRPERLGHLQHLVHLARRFAGMWSRRPVAAADVRWVDTVLLSGEATLWHSMTLADRRHAVLVARRFESIVAPAEPGRDELAAALLHDVGKLRSGLGTWSRVAATVVGPRTRRFRLYHEHELIGAGMLRTAGSTARTIALVEGSSLDQVIVDALRSADDI